MGTMKIFHRLLCLNILLCSSGLLWKAPVDNIDLSCGWSAEASSLTILILMLCFFKNGFYSSWTFFLQ